MESLKLPAKRNPNRLPTKLHCEVHKLANGKMLCDRSVEEPIGCKWIYKRKTNPDGSTRFKARLVIKGYKQKEGIDYDETYAPVSKMATFRLILVLAAQYGWDVDHMDVVMAFLNPRID